METILLGSLPASTPNTKQPFSISGTVPDGYELLGLICDLNGTMKSTASTFNLQAADANTVLNAHYSRIRMRAWGVDDKYNLNPYEGRWEASRANAEDPATVDPNFAVGAAVPASGGSAQAFHLPWPIWFLDRNLDTPEMFVPSTDQFNVDGHKLTVELAAGGTGLVLAGGTANFVVNSFDIYGVVNPSDTVFFGPPHDWRQLAVAQNRFPEDMQAIDVVLADERDPYTVLAQVAQVSIIRDSVRNSPQNIPPPVLAQRFLESLASMDGLRPVNLTKNSLGGVGSQMSPYAWINGALRATEWQLPFSMSNRLLFQNLAPGGSAVATLFNHRVLPFGSVAGEVNKLLGRKGFSVSSLDDLEIRGGGGRDNDVLAPFKGRYLARKGARKGA